MLPTRALYARIRDQLNAQILEGRYADGDPVPSVRKVATKTGANPLTVAKAYRELIEGGVLKVRRGVGCFVADGAMHRLRVKEQARFLADDWPAISDEIKRLGLSREELLGLTKPAGRY